MSIVSNNKWHWIAVVLAIPAIFSHLGYVPLDMSTDEARRALVALEMDVSCDLSVVYSVEIGMFVGDSIATRGEE